MEGGGWTLEAGRWRLERLEGTATVSHNSALQMFANTCDKGVAECALRSLHRPPLRLKMENTGVAKVGLSFDVRVLALLSSLD